MVLGIRDELRQLSKGEEGVLGEKRGGRGLKFLLLIPSPFEFDLNSVRFRFITGFDTVLVAV